MAVSRSMAGEWGTPLPMEFVALDEGRFQSEDGAFCITVTDPVKGDVCLQAGGVDYLGRVNYERTRLTWQNGGLWTKPMGPVSRDLGPPEVVTRDISPPGESGEGFGQKHVLSDSQMDVIIDKVNEKIDIFLLTEKMERFLIKGPANQANENLHTAMLSFMEAEWAAVIRLLLDEGLSNEVKQERIHVVLNAKLREPLATALNGRINIPMVSEEHEQKLFSHLVDAVLEKIIEMSIMGLGKSSFMR